jgi:glucose/arabinose dehydrogenase
MDHPWGMAFLPNGDMLVTVRQGPDGLIYVLTDETDGAMFRIEPAR